MGLVLISNYHIYIIRGVTRDVQGGRGAAIAGASQFKHAYYRLVNLEIQRELIVNCFY